jgi:hypothetical protein
MLLSAQKGEINGVQCSSTYGRIPNSGIQIPKATAGHSRTLRTETPSSQKVPDISMGKVRLRGRHTESRTACVWAPVANFNMIMCQGVVPTVVAVETSKQLGQATSITRKRGPLSEVMSLVRT